MARWRLTGAHYLNVPGVEWEQRETDTDSGQQVRKVYPVPILLDPLNPGNCQRRFNHPDGYVVCWEGKGDRNDIIFVGPPTPEMEPLDEEAEAISKVESKKWVNKPESGQDYGEAMIQAFQRQMDQIFSSGNTAPANVSAGSVSKADFEALQAQVAALMARNAELEATQDKRRD